jgi:hypothetical protein
MLMVGSYTNLRATTERGTAGHPSLPPRRGLLYPIWRSVMSEKPPRSCTMSRRIGAHTDGVVKIAGMVSQGRIRSSHDQKSHGSGTQRLTCVEAYLLNPKDGGRARPFCNRGLDRLAPCHHQEVQTAPSPRPEIHNEVLVMMNPDDHGLDRRQDTPLLSR